MKISDGGELSDATCISSSDPGTGIGYRQSTLTCYTYPTQSTDSPQRCWTRYTTSKSLLTITIQRDRTIWCQCAYILWKIGMMYNNIITKKIKYRRNLKLLRAIVQLHLNAFLHFAIAQTQSSSFESLDARAQRLKAVRTLRIS